MQEEMWEKVEHVAERLVQRQGWGLSKADQNETVGDVLADLVLWYFDEGPQPSEEHTLHYLRKRAQGECRNRPTRRKATVSLEDQVPKEREGVTYSDVLVDEKNPDPLERVLRDETAAEILAQVENPLWIEVLALISTGYSCEEAADILRIRVGTVKSRLNRCRAHLEMRLRVKGDQ